MNEFQDMLIEFFQKIPESKRPAGYVRELMEIGFTLDDIEAALEATTWIPSKEAVGNWKKFCADGIRAMKAEEDPEWQRQCRLRYVTMRIEEQETAMKDLNKHNIPLWWIIAVFEKTGGNKWRKEKRMLETFHHRKNGITQLQIQHACAYPIGDLLQLNQRGYAKCVNHSPDEHPSMYCKNNYAYCFVCHWHGSVIDVAMKLWGCPFPEAVRRLQ